jgi:gamma-glutamylcyclotransferase (GGCT)/AIG2-like uncharacterized protein YtfP
MKTEHSLRRIFVYGTLLTGCRNYEKILTSKVENAEEAYLYGKLYYLPHYNCPALVDGNDKIVGEVLTLVDDQELLDCMDELEEFTGDLESSVYYRIPRIVYVSGHREVLDVYLFADREQVDEINYIPAGSWREFVQTAQVS